MSANLVKKMRVAITNGDAIASNRFEGKSNTGTYFISSLEEFRDKFSPFIDLTGAKNIVYQFDVQKIIAYSNELYDLIICKIPKFANNFSEYNNAAHYFSSKGRFIPVEVGYRSNDSRVFMRFLDNNNADVKCFRKLLYAKFSMLVFELNALGDVCTIYPEIDYDEVEKYEREGVNL